MKCRLLTLAIVAAALPGCQTLDKINPFKHRPLKAPCNAVASASGDTLADVSQACDWKTLNTDRPDADELLQLRGPIDPSTGRSVGIVIAAP